MAKYRRSIAQWYLAPPSRRKSMYDDTFRGPYSCLIGLLENPQREPGASYGRMIRSQLDDLPCGYKVF